MSSVEEDEFFLEIKNDSHHCIGLSHGRRLLDIQHAVCISLFVFARALFPSHVCPRPCLTASRQRMHQSTETKDRSCESALSCLVRPLPCASSRSWANPADGRTQQDTAACLRCVCACQSVCVCGTWPSWRSKRPGRAPPRHEHPMPSTEIPRLADLQSSSE